MEDEYFNDYKLNTILWQVVEPALKLQFKTLWDKKFSDRPWSWDPKWVKLFEEKEEEMFQERLSKTDNSTKHRMKSIKTTRQHKVTTMKSEDEWKNGNWDISKLVYALVDSKLLKLDKTDENGKPLSERLTEIRKLRNKRAHSHPYDNKTAESKMMSLEEHIKYLEIPQSHRDNFIKELQKKVTQAKPVSSEELNKIKTENDMYKLQNDNLVTKVKFYKRERRLERKTHHMERKIAEVTAEFDKLKQEAEDTKLENETLKDKVLTLTTKLTKRKEKSDKAEKDRKKSVQHQKEKGDKLKSKYLKSKQENTKLRQQLDDSESKTERLNDEIERLTKESKNLHEILDQTNHDLKKITTRKQELEEKLEQCKLEYFKEKQDKNNIKQHADDPGSENEKLKQEKESLIDDLRDLIEKYGAENELRKIYQIKSINMQKELQQSQEEDDSTILDVEGQCQYDLKTQLNDLRNKVEDQGQDFFKIKGTMEEDTFTLTGTCRQEHYNKIKID